MPNVNFVNHPSAIAEEHAVTKIAATCRNFMTNRKQKGKHMYSLLPAESLTGAMEIICCFFTIIGAFASYMMTMRF